MKLRKFPIVFITLMFLIACIPIAGQRRTGAELIDEFGQLPCGHIQAKTDAFAEEIKRGPGAKAIVLIYPAAQHAEQAMGRRKLISSFLQLRGLAIDQFVFYRGNGSPGRGIQTQFWKTVDSAELPFADAMLWNDARLDTSRDFIFGFSYEIDICPTFVPSAFAKLILDNPDSRGHIVVRRGSDAMENRFYFADRHVKELVEEYGVPRERLRLFFARGRNSLVAEFWFVPAREK